MLFGPFHDLRGGQKHALHEGAVTLEIQMFVAALVRAGGQANRQDEIDHVHSAPDVACAAFAADAPHPAARSWIGRFMDFLKVPEQEVDIGEATRSAKS